MTLREAVEKFFNEKKYMKKIENPPFDRCDAVKNEGDVYNGCSWYIYDGVGYICKNMKDRFGRVRETWFECFN